MSSQNSVDAGRRRFLAGAAAAGSAIGAPLSPLMAASAGLPGAVPGRDMVVLYDERMPMDPAALQRLESAGARCLPLGGDPVRLWRGESAGLLCARGTRLLGMTRWADLLMVRGLAAESGRRLQFEKLDPTTGVFTWLIA